MSVSVSTSISMSSSQVDWLDGGELAKDSAYPEACELGGYSLCELKKPASVIVDWELDIHDSACELGGELAHDSACELGGGDPAYDTVICEEVGEVWEDVGELCEDVAALSCEDSGETCDDAGALSWDDINAYCLVISSTSCERL